MKFDFAISSPMLQPYIKQYWAIENILDKRQEHTQRIVATGLPELTFYFGNRPKSDRRNLEGNALINGQQNDYYDLIVSDVLSMFSITFQPNGLSYFLNIPLNEIQNQIVYFENIDKNFCKQIEEKLTEATTFRKRVEIIESFFLQRLVLHKSSIDHKRMKSTIELIKSTRGNISIEALSSHSCLSRKQFERKFQIHIGISPKQFLKIIRFQNVIDLWQTSKNSNLTELAYLANYYDQSHFINDIKDLTGQTPKKLFEMCDISSDFFR